MTEKLSTLDHRPPTTDHRPPTTDHRPPTTDHRPPTTDRDSILDSLRGFAIILVVIGHVIGGFRQGGLTFTGMSSLYDFIYSFHMPLFFMIAGYVQGMRRTTHKNYLKKYAIDLYLPCLYFSLLYWLLKYILISPSNNVDNVVLTSIDELYMIPLKGFNEYWFLCTLFFIKSIHSYIEDKFPDSNINSVLWLVVFIAAKFLGFSFLDETAKFSYGFYFHAGFLIRKHDLIAKNHHPAASYGLMFLAVGVMSFIMPHVFGRTSAFTSTAAALLTSLGLMIAAYAFGISNNFLVSYGALSMVVYAIHNYVIFSMRVIYRFAGLSSTENIAILFVISTIVAVGVPMILVKLYQNVKCLRWIEYIFYPGKLRHQVQPDHAHDSPDNLPQ